MIRSDKITICAGGIIGFLVGFVWAQLALRHDEEYHMPLYNMGEHPSQKQRLYDSSHFS
jgi:hypothetical protein